MQTFVGDKSDCGFGIEDYTDRTFVGFSLEYRIRCCLRTLSSFQFLTVNTLVFLVDFLQVRNRCRNDKTDLIASDLLNYKHCMTELKILLNYKEDFKKNANEIIKLVNSLHQTKKQWQKIQFRLFLQSN